MWIYSVPFAGLGYGSDSDDDGDERGDVRRPVSSDNSDSSDTDAEDLIQRARHKRREFAKKMDEREGK